MNELGILTIFTFVISRRNEARAMRKVTVDRRYSISQAEALEYLDRFKEENPGLQVEAIHTVYSYLT